MLKNVEWSVDRDYKTGSENEPLQFYLDGLANSNEFSLLLGYFSSSAINLLSVGFATFISKGGKMRMVINHLLSQKDKETILKVEDNPNEIRVFDLTDIVELQRNLDEYDTHFFECLAYMVLQKRIEIKVIKPKNGRGIAHYKSGVFGDGQNFVGYQASCNFTLYGLAENLEHLQAFLSWENGRSNKFITSQLKDIDNYFTEKDDDVEYIPVDEIEVVLKEKFGKKDINELLVQEEELSRKKMALFRNKNLKSTIVKLYENIDEIRKKPRFPYIEGPRDYQSTAFENWKKNNQKGLFAMATGTGKTITSLNCLLEIYKKSGYYKALILVPTITLVDQWEAECRKFNFHNIIKVTSKSRGWKSDVANLRVLEMSNADSSLSYVIISTYASFIRPNIFDELNKFPKQKLLLIADEAHNMGSGQMINRLNEIPYLRRIGLSATPERQFDEVGNQKLMNFFGCVTDYTFEYSMAEAIKNGALCRYYYYPHVVRLTEHEMEQYIELSITIARIMGFKDSESQEILKRLLLKRKRIIHKAENKKDVFETIIKARRQEYGSLKYTLVYVPEGNKPDDNEADIFDETDVLNSDEDSMHLIDEYTRIVRDTDSRVVVRQFTSESKEREPMLKDFAAGNIDVLTSMKCLDEGVDVPRSELAIFCSSTGNPRQFIQRRGRVLRTHKDKHVAIIHDLVVVPDNCFSVETYELERSLVSTELKRVRDFATLSENLNDTDRELQDVLNHYNLSIFN